MCNFFFFLFLDLKTILISKLKFKSFFTKKKKKKLLIKIYSVQKHSTKQNKLEDIRTYQNQL